MSLSIGPRPTVNLGLSGIWRSIPISHDVLIMFSSMMSHMLSVIIFDRSSFFIMALSLKFYLDWHLIGIHIPSKFDSRSSMQNWIWIWVLRMYYMHKFRSKHAWIQIWPDYTLNIFSCSLPWQVKYVLDNCKEDMDFFNTWIEKGIVNRLSVCA